MFGLVDCNNFFASCERLFHPELMHKPVVVLSNNDGCVVARSNEAKRLGIKMGQPLFQIRDWVDSGKVVAFSSNYALYSDLSRRVHNTLKSLVPKTEVYSIDESFIDLSELKIADYKEYASRIRSVITQHTGIPVSVGISQTKTLAKLATELCKQYPKLRGVCFMCREEDILKVLKKTPVGEIWGIGRRYSKMLNERRINTAFDFYNLPESWVQSWMTSVSVKTWRELHGEAVIEFNDHYRDKQRICTSRSFDHEISDMEQLKEQLAIFASQSAEKLRKQGDVCGEILIFLRTNYFRKNVPQYTDCLPVVLPMDTDSTIEIVKAVSENLPRIFRKEVAYKKAGVVLSRIHSKSALQTTMFEGYNVEKQTKIMQIMDGAKKKWGSNVLNVAAVGSQHIASSKNYLSREYTTRWDDILEIS